MFIYNCDNKWWDSSSENDIGEPKMLNEYYCSITLYIYRNIELFYITLLLFFNNQFLDSFIVSFFFYSYCSSNYRNKFSLFSDLSRKR